MIILSKLVKSFHFMEMKFLISGFQFFLLFILIK